MARMFISIYLGTVGDIHLGNNTAPPTKAELALLSSRYMDAWLTFAEVSRLLYGICDL
jgi:hypothetical protein